MAEAARDGVPAGSSRTAPDQPPPEKQHKSTHELEEAGKGRFSEVGR